ncbi:MAG TPA: MarR family winged helix-turn-helix transcriptional regulator [Streptosporangiaceae bacterium]|jgi:DNA-binding MarR family transcriptional regulator
MTLSAPSRTVPDLSYLLTYTGHVLSTKMTAAFAELDMTPRAYCVLFHADEAERTQAELAAISALDKTTMVTTMDALEKAGLAERRPSSTDRRARIIAVTGKGRDAIAKGTRIADRVHREAIESLPEDRRVVLIEALAALAEGHLSEPVESPTPVRRPRHSQK